MKSPEKEGVPGVEKKSKKPRKKEKKPKEREREKKKKDKKVCEGPRLRPVQSQGRRGWDRASPARAMPREPLFWASLLQTN